AVLVRHHAAEPATARGARPPRRPARLRWGARAAAADRDGAGRALRRTPDDRGHATTAAGRLERRAARPLALLHLPGAVRGDVGAAAGRDRGRGRPGAGAAALMGTYITPAPLSYYLLLSVVLFTLGVIGFLKNKNPLVMFMSVEIML